MNNQDTSLVWTALQKTRPPGIKCPALESNKIPVLWTVRMVWTQCQPTNVGLDEPQWSHATWTTQTIKPEHAQLAQQQKQKLFDSITHYHYEETPPVAHQSSPPPYQSHLRSSNHFFMLPTCSSSIPQRVPSVDYTPPSPLPKSPTRRPPSTNYFQPSLPTRNSNSKDS